MDAEIDRLLGEIISPLYRVGGSVRDELLGRPVTDFDYATSLRPDEVEAAVRAAGKKPFLVGKRFGTIGLRLDGHHIEITTFRQERYTPGSRKPEVSYVDDITADLSRRDFTVNAMALREGRLIDPFGGRADSEARLLRAVGTPSERFHEDPLRMVRLARFAAQLGFAVEEATLKAAQKQAHLILQVSRERWSQELDKLLLSERPSLGLRVLAQSCLLNFVLPELGLQVGYDQHSPYHTHDLFEHSLRTVDGVPAEIELRWAALLHDIGKPFVKTEKPSGQWNFVHHEEIGAEAADRIGRYLKWGNERREAVRKLVAEHMGEAADPRLQRADQAAH